MQKSRRYQSNPVDNFGSYHALISPLNQAVKEPLIRDTQENDNTKLRYQNLHQLKSLHNKTNLYDDISMIERQLVNTNMPMPDKMPKSRNERLLKRAQKAALSLENGTDF